MKSELKKLRQGLSNSGAERKIPLWDINRYRGSQRDEITVEFSTVKTYTEKIVSKHVLSFKPENMKSRKLHLVRGK